MIASCLDNGLGKTPPMGWNSFNYFDCVINETLIKEVADGMVDHGFLKAGYKYLNIDDGWSNDYRNESGYLLPDPDAFPSGMKVLVDYVHSKGLLFGIYADAGLTTCVKRPGSLNYEKKDAQVFAEWEVDYLKYDNCDNMGLPAMDRYKASHKDKMRDALNATKRPIYFSICEWGENKPFLWAPPIGNSWRTTQDIKANWTSILTILDTQRNITNYAGPGGWNDPDMLEIGNGNLTLDEQRSHFSFWAALKAPLILGFDIRNPPPDAKDMALNTEIIAVNQDPLGVSVNIVEHNKYYEIWTGPLSDGYVA
ncbi:12429_t:CDS:10, partial [Cetraspora pellucida]